MADSPKRGEIWSIDLNPVRGREQGGRRPALIVSVDAFNRSAADLVMVLPLTSREKNVRTHVPIDPLESGLTRPSWIKCEDLRSVSRQRLGRRIGSCAPPTLSNVEDRLRILLAL